MQIFVLIFTDVDDLYCGPHEFTCKQAHRCIPIQKQCDRENDCNDWEDELGCGKGLVCVLILARLYCHCDDGDKDDDSNIYINHISIDDDDDDLID